MPGTLTISTLSDGTNSTSATNPILGSARAWSLFNGDAATVTNSYNVSSITKLQVGEYRLNFTNALPNTNYAVIGVTNYVMSGSDSSATLNSARATTSTAVQVWANGALRDTTDLGVAVFSS